MKGKRIEFARPKDCHAVEQSWDVSNLARVPKAQNDALLDGIAQLIRQHAGVEFEIHGEACEADASDAKMIAYYKLRNGKENLGKLMSHLARNRATACAQALVTRGVAAAQLKVSCRTQTGGRVTEFVPRCISGLGAAGFKPVLKEFRVMPHFDEVPQEVVVSLERSTADLHIKLVNARAESEHWSSTLPVASGVPITIRHKRLGIWVERRP